MTNKTFKEFVAEASAPGPKASHKEHHDFHEKMYKRYSKHKNTASANEDASRIRQAAQHKKLMDYHAKAIADGKGDKTPLSEEVELDEAAGETVTATNADGHSVHTDGKRVWTKSGNKGASAPPSLANFSADQSSGTSKKIADLKGAILSGHAKGKEGVIAALKKHGHSHHNWK